MNEKTKTFSRAKNLQKRKTPGSLSLLSFACGEGQERRSRGGTGMMRARANVSHLTCNKAEQISCSLPLNVRLPPQGVRTSFNALFSQASSQSANFSPPSPAKETRLLYVDLLLGRHSSKEDTDHKPVGTSQDQCLLGFSTVCKSYSDGPSQRGPRRPSAAVTQGRVLK